MKLAITGRHLVVSPEIRDQIERKLARLDRVLNDSAVSAQCVLAHEKREIVCELTVHARGDHDLVGIGRHKQMAGAVAAAVAKVTQQAERLADRWKTRRKTAASPRAAAAKSGKPPVAPPRAAGGSKVVRARGYVVEAMTVDDAALALESGDHPVVVFRRSPSAPVSVLFRRRDGQVGLIDTQA